MILVKLLLTPDVVTVGDVNIDLITEPLKSNIVNQKDVEVVTRLHQVLGGNAGNCAMALAKLGLQSRLIGALSDDPISIWLINQLKANGVEYHNCFKSITAAITIALTYDDGTRTFLSDFGTNALLSLEDINLKLIDGKHLHRAGYWWAPKMMGSGTKQLFQHAQKHGLTTSLDIGWDPNGWVKTSRESVYQCLPFCDILFLNDKELESLTQTNLEDGATSLLERGLHMIGLHYGARGCKIYTTDGMIHIPSYNVALANPTGTGDIFNAAFIYGYLHQWALEKVGRFANAAAALHLKNAATPFPTLQEISTFLDFK